MRAEHLKECLAEAQKEEAIAAKAAATEGVSSVLGGQGGGGTSEKRDKAPAEMTNWEKVVALARATFGEGLLAEEAMWQAVVLIPKGKGDYRGIGIVDMMWKVVAAILN